jgi:ABC-type nitrate/sulfonate/bicarbonate transport system permease component
MNKKIKLILISLSWFLLLLTWQLSDTFSRNNNSFFSSPTQILQVFFTPSYWTQLAPHFWSTSSSLVISFILGFILSHLIFYIFGYFEFGKNFLKQIIQLLKYVPAPVLIPIGILIFGINQQTQLFAITLSFVLLYISFLFNIEEKEENNFHDLQTAWQINYNFKYKNFFFPISNYLNYRAIPSIVIWMLGVAIFCEIVIGLELGLGIKILEYQQFSRTDYLYATILFTMFMAFLLEKTLVLLFARFKLDYLKIIAIIITICSIILSLAFFAQGFFNNTSKEKIVSYKAVVNLPLMVYAEKFNSLDIELDFVSSGILASQTVQFDKARIAGYVDTPNAMGLHAQKPSVIAVSQVVETKTQPVLYFLSQKDLSLNNFQDLNNSKVGYYPNNLLIKQGLDFVFFLNKANTQTIEYTSANDPVILSESLVNGGIDGLLTVEPFATDLEQTLNIERLNPKQSMISNLNFEKLPLGSLILDKEDFKDDELETFLQDINKSIDFISQNITSDYKPKGDLIQIMQKYGLNSNASIPVFETQKNLDPKNLELLIELIKTYQPDLGFENFDGQKFYDLD